MPIRTDPARPRSAGPARRAPGADRLLPVRRAGRLPRRRPVRARRTAGARGARDPRRLRGHRVAGDARLGAALRQAGGRLCRHAHVLSHDLHDMNAPGAGAPLAHAAADLVPAHLAAYGPGHPDAAARAGEDPYEEVRRLLDGGGLGPLLGCSGVTLDGDRVVAAIIVTDCPGAPPFGGPWVAELFRDPAYRGSGRALLERALHRAASQGLPALSLAVTHGNPALRLYEALGFAHAPTAMSVDL